MSVYNSAPRSCETEQIRRTSPQEVPSEGSPQGVMEGRSETCLVSDHRRLTFFEAEQMAREQIGLSTLYVRPPEPTDAQSFRRWKEYHDMMKLAEALCMTIAEVYTMGAGRLIRVDGEEIEAEVVKAIFFRLRGEHVDKVICSLRMVEEPEKKQARLNRRYFRAALYNAVFELAAQEQVGVGRLTDERQIYDKS